MMADDKREQPPISLTRESLRISAASLVSMVATVFVLWFFLDDHWVTHKEYDKDKAGIELNLANHEKDDHKNNAEQTQKLMKFAYFLRMGSLQDMIEHLKTKKLVAPQYWSAADDVTLLMLQDEYNQVNEMYKTDQLKPK